MNPDELSFVTAIKANRDCHTTRLVYADWLQEHDREPQAQLIRLTAKYMQLTNKKGRIDNVIGDFTRQQIRVWVETHPDLRLICPVCDGGKYDRGIVIGPGNNACPNGCGGCGRAGTFDDFGLLASVKVDNLLRLLTRRPANDGAGSWEWAPTEWATDLIHRFPFLTQITLTDRVPFHYDYGAMGPKRQHRWARYGPGLPDDGDYLPDIIFDAIPQRACDRVGVGNARYFETHHDAVETLSIVVADVTRNLVEADDAKRKAVPVTGE